jgi:hypothetical protein
MLSLIAMLSLTASAQANEIPCANMAKYAAIRAYKAEVGEVQGSDGIKYSATVASARYNAVFYLVSIRENNEDGESWEFKYSVALRYEPKGKPQCTVLWTKKN